MLESRLPVVAVVDDQEAKRYAMARTLRGAGFSVREGGSGREALSLASEAPDVLVLDIKLPDANGLELCRQIKANPQTASVLVLVVSAYQTSEADRAEGLESGADAYLTHPVEPPVLVATARALLRLRRAEQERSEALVRERSARSEAESAAADFRTLAESVPHLVWKARPDGQVDYVNSRWTEYTGMAAEASFGFSFVDAVHPDDRAAYLASWRRNVSVGAHEDAEVRLRRASDGRYRWYLVRSRPLRDEGGQTTGWVGTCTDVDDQKRAVEASQMLAEVSKALGAAITVDAMAEAVVQLCVPALGTFCALDMVTEEGAVRRVSLQVGKAPRAELVEPLGALKRSGPDAGPGHILRHGDVEWVPQVDDAWLSRAFPETDARKVWHALALRSFFSVPLHSRGGVLGALSLGNTDGDNGYEAWKQPLVEDLARRVGPALENARLFDLARRERDNAEEANRAKDEFLAVVSHELRTPLNAMLGWTQMLRSGLLSLPKQERALEAVERNVRVQTQLIDDLLDISRIITGKLRLNVGPTSPALVMEAALDSVRPAAEAKGIHLVAHMEGNGTPVTGDPDRLQQVVWNLLSNGIKFTPPEGRSSFPRAERIRSWRSVFAIPGSASARSFFHMFSSASGRRTPPRLGPRAGWAWGSPSCGTWWSFMAGPSRVAAKGQERGHCSSFDFRWGLRR